MLKMKKCSKCGMELPMNNFSKDKGKKNGLQSHCKECCARYKKIYREANKEVIAEHSKVYREVNKESIAEYDKIYRKANKESRADQYNLWRQANPEKYCILIQRYRARKRALPSTLTIEQWESTKLYFSNSCAYCGKERPLAQEHFLALSKGGEYTHNNIIPSCQSCNSSKNVKNFFEWYPNHKHYSKKREKSILTYLGYNNNVQQLSIL